MPQEEGRGVESLEIYLVHIQDMKYLYFFCQDFVNGTPANGYCCNAVVFSFCSYVLYLLLNCLNMHCLSPLELPCISLSFFCVPDPFLCGNPFIVYREVLQVAN